MNIYKAEELRKAWDGKPCNHPSFEVETFPATYETGWVESKTGDYVCTQCGETFTKNEMLEIKNKNQRHKQ